jgi:hypothetical protein
MGKKRWLAAVVSAAAVAGLTAGSALAGEITGNGKWIAGSEEAPLHGNSECAFSGQNDEFVLGDESAPRTQSWGASFARGSGGAFGGVPGTACNPTGGPG